MKMPFSLALLSPGLLLAAACAGHPVQRYAMVIGLDEQQVDEYTALHADPWPEVLAQLDRSHVRNYSIWLVERAPGEPLLFGYLEYDGDDFEADMAAMAADDATRRWWMRTAPCQIPIPSAAPGQQWVMMREVFYHDPHRPGASRMPPPPPFEGGRS